MPDWKVKVYIILNIFLSPLYLLVGPIVNGVQLIKERHVDSDCLGRTLNILLAPLVLLLCMVFGVVLTAVLTVPSVLINFVRFWRIVLAENGLNVL